MKKLTLSFLRLFPAALGAALMLASAPAHADKQYVYDGYTIATEPDDVYKKPYEGAPNTVQPTKSPLHEARLTIMTASAHWKAHADTYDYNDFNPGVGLIQPIYHDWLSLDFGADYNFYSRMAIYGGLVLEPTIYEWSRGKFKLGGELNLTTGVRESEDSLEPITGNFLIEYMYKDEQQRSRFGIDVLLMPKFGDTSGYAALQLEIPLGVGLY